MPGEAYPLSDKLLTDPYGRRFPYLRLSLTDACNFRCTYCLPDGFRKKEEDAPLSVAEIRRLVGAFAAMGTWKIRLTGGEPTLRPDVVAIAAAVAGVPGIRSVAISTNGFRLAALAGDLARAGVGAANVSVDSLDPARFRRLTGSDDLAGVLRGIDEALAAGMRVKMNAVLLGGENDGELGDFMAFVKERPIAVRFIELMRTHENGALFDAHHLSATVLQARLLAAGWRRRERGEADGPAVEFAHADYTGRIGLIAPYSPDFCSTCNRLRIDARGRLRLCLFGEGGVALRPWLGSDGAAAGVGAVVRAALGHKDISHHLQEGRYGDTRNFASSGG